ncbi:MAG: hypothetical protein JWR19_1084 [Pedosphaera sp.]|nr:hypothetical protein [Pedosphaera sp.]
MEVRLFLCSYIFVKLLGPVFMFSTFVISLNPLHVGAETVLTRASGDYDVEFNRSQILWETGAVSWAVSI